jgi:hypothetical protein
LKAKLTQPFPEALGVIVGDAANNLRAALDHAVYGVAIGSGRVNNPREAYFPFSRTAVEFESNMKGRCKHVPHEIYPLFRTLKPYRGGNTLLWALNELCVLDKHKTVTPIGGGSLRNKAHVSSTSGGFWKMPVIHTWDRAKNEMILLTARADAKIHHELDFTFFVAFDEIPTIEGRPLDGVLNEMVGEVESVLWAIETETRRLFPAAFF